MSDYSPDENDYTYDYFRQQLDPNFNDELLPTPRPPSLSVGAYYQQQQQPLTRPRTSASLLTGPISGISSFSRPTSEAFSLAGIVRDRRWQQSRSSLAASEISAAPAIPKRSIASKQRPQVDDDDENEDDLDAYVVDDRYADKKIRTAEKWQYSVPVVRRTWKQWFHRIAIYFGVITFFFGFHLGMWALFWASVDLNNPAFSHYIMLEPALNFRPKPRGDDWGTFLHWNRRDRAAIRELMDSMSKVVEMYEEEVVGDNPNGDHHTWTKVCDFDNIADDENACWIDTRAFGTYCYKSQLYGFDDGKPCILIRINKLVNWVPDPFDTLADMKAAGFPLDWKEEDYTPGYVPITCEGQTDVDKELLGPMRYFYPLLGYNGIATYYFPFNGQLHYAPPGVMVNFYNVTFAVPIRIICKLWAKNVKHRRDGPLGHMTGSVEFEMMIDSGMVNQEERNNN